VYIADNLNNRIRKVTVSTGVITTIAGIGGARYSGDNGDATSARLYYPSGVSLDSSGTSSHSFHLEYDFLLFILIICRKCLYR
jgi:hypothetical protein